MKRLRRARPPAFLLCLAALGAANGSGVVERDPLAAEIERWSAFVREHETKDELWTQIKQASEPALAQAHEALRGGRRLLALQRLAAARANAAAFAWKETVSPERRQALSTLEAEWARAGKALQADLGKTSASALGDVAPAAFRGLAEASLPQVRVFYEASLEYGRNTMADAGFFYLGLARAQRGFVSLCRRLSTRSSLRPPPLRSLDVELDALEGELLAAYRPPAAIDRHSDFIAASASLKEARELDRAGLRYGALLRYLQGAQKSALLRPKPASLDAAALNAGMRELDSRLSAERIDHTIGRLFLESARAEAASAATGVPSPVAAAIVSDVLPRYFDALAPRGAEPSKPAARVTVTLVRWPYT
jgi:hypothetical protein